jgi:hypothetical protein
MPSKGWPYGEGKSTLAGQILKRIYMEFYGYDEWTAWEMVKQNFGYNWKHYHDVILRGMMEQRQGGYIQDDLQEIAGKDKAHNKSVQWTAKQLTTKRPYLGVFLATCTQLGDLASRWRSVFLFEIKVYVRGKYEVQYIKTKTRFNDPENPRKLMDIKDVPPVKGTFDKFPPDIQKWYSAFRHEHNVDSFKIGWAEHFGSEGEPLTDVDERILTKRGFIDLYRSKGLRGDDHKIGSLYDEIKPLVPLTT